MYRLMMFYNVTIMERTCTQDSQSVGQACGHFLLFAHLHFGGSARHDAPPPIEKSKNSPLRRVASTHVSKSTREYVRFGVYESIWSKLLSAELRNCQQPFWPAGSVPCGCACRKWVWQRMMFPQLRQLVPVSYTHLTLPTIYSV